MTCEWENPRLQSWDENEQKRFVSLKNNKTMMLKTYKYRLYPNKEQEIRLEA
ncbi:MAG TPA: hypothetical protein ENI78_01210, partial [Euryarchaeota archaeon]|nr:hypothetical protein [Euryarchaeota archaeon]